MDQVERWAGYVRDHPAEWRRHLKPFLDSQVIMANRFYQRLAETAEGRETLHRLGKLVPGDREP